MNGLKDLAFFALKKYSINNNRANPAMNGGLWIQNWAKILLACKFDFNLFHFSL
jgi:hypothetical protein